MIALLSAVIFCVATSLGSSLSPPCRVQHNSPVNWTVDCSRLNASELPSNFDGLPVTKVVLSRNHFDSSLIFRNWPSLREIDLSYNRLDFLPDDMLTDYNDLQYLNLSSNQIKNISSHHLVSNLLVKALDLSNNTDLARNPRFLQDLRPILRRGTRLLSLHSTGLRHIPRTFFNESYELTRLDLRRNNVDYLPQFPSSLVYLDVSENPFKNVTLDVLGLCINLETLIVESNPNFEVLTSDAFHFIKKIVRLSLKGNKKLSFLPDGLFFHNHLKYLDLSYCAIHTLSHSFATPFRRLDFVDLLGNPWECDDNISWFLKLNTSSEELRCASSNVTFASFYGAGFNHSLLRDILIVLLLLNLVVFTLSMWCTYNLELKAKLKHTYSQLDSKKEDQNTVYVSTVV